MGAVLGTLLASWVALVGATDKLPRVVLLPLGAEGDVDATTAEGLSALLRQELERAGEGGEGEAFLDVAPEDKKDQKRARSCRLDEDCLEKLLKQRGVDMLAGGAVRPTETALELELVVALREGGIRRVREGVGGDEAEMALAFQRLVRAAFAPQTLAGSVIVTGAVEGAEILVDGKRVGFAPVEKPIHGLVEGDHEITARADGYKTLSRRVRVRFGSTTEVSLVQARMGALGQPEEEATTSSTLGPWLLGGGGVVGGVAAVLLVGGVAAGVGALVQGLQVQARADAQQLVFPRDELLVRSGQVLALSANVLYAGAAVAGAAGAGLAGAGLVLPLLDGPEEAEAYEGPARGAPTTAPRRRLSDDEEEEPVIAAPEDDEDDEPADDVEMPRGEGPR